MRWITRLLYQAFCGICGRMTEHDGFRCSVCGN